MELSVEDDLRLNVLLLNDIQAIRIDEGKMTLHALSDQGEATLKLNPTGRAEQYVRAIRETISGHVLGSPGGYPLYIKRWTRMGQIKSRLDDLLRLGEPEAVSAVVHSPDITNELARRAWWCIPTAENARRMLANEAVATGDMGVALAEFLVEFLPFEEDPAQAMISVQLVLQPGLIEDEVRARLWKIGHRKNALRVGFLSATPDDLPDTSPARKDLATYQTELQALADAGNSAAALLLQILGEQGQSFITIAEQILKKPATQQVVSGLLNAVSNYFTLADEREQRHLQRREMDDITTEVHALLDSVDATDPLAQLLEKLPMLRPELVAMLVLGRTTESVVTRVFAHSTAVGSVMRKQIKPVADELFSHFAALKG